MGYKRRRISKTSLRRLRRVKRRLFSTVVKHRVGEGVMPNIECIKGPKKRSRPSFNEKVSRALMPAYTQIQNASGQLTCEDGKQNSVDIGMFGDFSRTVSLFQKSKDTYANATTSLGSMTNSGSFVPDGASGNDPATYGYGLYMDYMSCAFTFVNTCNVTQDVEFIVVTPTMNMPELQYNNVNWSNDPKSIWQLACQKTGITANAQDPIVPSNPNGVTGTLQTTVNDLGSKPYDPIYRYNFGKYWKIVKKVNVSMLPGAIQKLYVRRNGPKLLDWETIQATGNFYIPNLCYRLLVIHKGQVVNGTTSGSSDITTAPCELSYTFQVKNKVFLRNYLRQKIYSLSYLSQSLGSFNIQREDGDVDTYNNSTSIDASEQKVFVTNTGVAERVPVQTTF